MIGMVVFELMNLVIEYLQRCVLLLFSNFTSYSMSHDCRDSESQTHESKSLKLISLIHI